MTNPTTVELAAWLEDAIDPDRTEEIDRLVAATPALAARVASLRARLYEVEVTSAPVWSLPLPGLRLAGAPRVDLRASTVMGDLTPGARFEVRIDDPPDPSATRLIVLTRGEGDWEVVFPVEPDEDMPVADLPATKGGGRLIGLVAGPTPGAQRWALVYADRSLLIDWDAPPEQRWTPLQVTLSQGLASATVVERTIAPRR